MLFLQISETQGSQTAGPSSMPHAEAQWIWNPWWHQLLVVVCFDGPASCRASQENGRQRIYFAGSIWSQRCQGQVVPCQSYALWRRRRQVPPGRYLLWSNPWGWKGLADCIHCDMLAFAHLPDLPRSRQQVSDICWRRRQCRASAPVDEADVLQPAKRGRRIPLWVPSNLDKSVGLHVWPYFFSEKKIQNVKKDRSHRSLLT